MAERGSRRLWVAPWERDPDSTGTSSAPYVHRTESETEERRERVAYAELEFMKLAELVRQDAEDTRTEPRKSSTCRLICLKNENGLERMYRHPVLAGSIIFNILLLTASISLLSLYLQLNAKLNEYRERREELRFNQSLLMKVLEEEKDLNLLLQANLSSLLESHTILRDHTLPLLLHDKEKTLQEIKMLEQKYGGLRENYTFLHKEFEKLVGNHLFVPRESVLLQNCQPRESTIDSKVCLYCPPGWQLYERSCYLLSPHVLSWQESLQWCRRQGGHLAVINNEDKQYFMQGFVKKTSWIGLSDRDMEGDWRWVDGTPYDTTPRFWVLRQPNNTGNEDCVTVSPGSGWNDEKCFKLYNSVCERGAYQLRWNGNVLSN